MSLVVFDNIAQVLSSDFNGLKTRQRFQIKPLEIQENIDLNECQSPVNWDAIPSPVDHILSELSIMTHLSWVALHGMAGLCSL